MRKIIHRMKIQEKQTKKREYIHQKKDQKLYRNEDEMFLFSKNYED